MIFGIIDIGSHTLRLAIYERKQKVDTLLTKSKFPIGLAGYLKNNVMEEEGIYALLSVLKKFREFLDAFKIEKVYAFATAAVRMSENKADILSRAKRETGFEIKIISGEEEAELAFIGATQESPVNHGAVIDIGGGSTEIVEFKGGKILKQYSLAIGAVALSKKYSAEFFPSLEARENIRNATIKAVQEANANLNVKDALALGGAAKGAKLLLNRTELEPIELKELNFLKEKFSKELTDVDKSLLLRTAADRAPILITGFVMLSALMESFHSERFYFCDGGVREGFMERYTK